MGAVREDMDDEREKHRETFCFAITMDVCERSPRPMSSAATAPRAPRPWLWIRVVADVTRMPL